MCPPASDNVPPHEGVARRRAKTHPQPLSGRDYGSGGAGGADTASGASMVDGGASVVSGVGLVVDVCVSLLKVLVVAVTTVSLGLRLRPNQAAAVIAMPLIAGRPYFWMFRIVMSADRRPVGAPWGVKIRRWSPVVLTSGTAGSLWAFVVVVPGKT
ncbi:MAG: hypothetical protein WCB92_16285, partial [Mycobacterium sp.]